MIDYHRIELELDGLNADLVECYQSPSQCVVLAKRRNPTWEELPYVTWEYDTGAGLFWGHYDLAQEHAHADFIRRCE